MRTVTTSELARHLRAVLDMVEYRGEEVAILRKQHPIARIVPGAPRLTALEVMTDLHGSLSDDAAEDWLDDSRRTGLATLNEVRDPWGF